MILFLILFIILGCIILYLYLKNQITSHRPTNAPTAQNRQKLDIAKTTLVCVGDSNTHGNVSYNWVDDLEVIYPDFQILNAGVNADLTGTLLRRLDDTIAAKPDLITLLIGTNDIQSSMSLSQEKRYREMKKIAPNEQTSYAIFCDNFSRIITRFKTETNAQIAVFSLPILSENLDHEANKKGDQYSDFIKQMAAQENLTYLPLRETQKAHLQQHPSQSKYSYEDTFRLMNLSILRNIFMKQSWDEISTIHGLRLTPDNIHQNSVSGQMIIDLVKTFIAKTT
jgi:lysophospholipase L1-like esterase